MKSMNIHRKSCYKVNKNNNKNNNKKYNKTKKEKKQMRLAISAQRKINNKNNKAEVFSTKNNSHLSNLQQSDSFDELLFVSLHLRSLVLCNLLLLPHPIHSLLFIQLVCSIWYISILALFTKKRRNGSFFFLFKYFV